MNRFRVFQIIETARSGDTASRLFDLALISLILINVMAFIASTVESIQEHYGLALATIEAISVKLFIIEYCTRIWACTASRQYPHPVTGRLRYALRPVMLIDLMAILPTLLLGLTGIDGRALRAIRLVRVFRLLRLSRYSDSLDMTLRVFQRKLPDLLAVFLVLLILLVLCSSVMYYAENSAQPDAFSSIPATMWWAAITLTTVGYGDISPVTGLGKLVATCVAFIGIGMFALPAGILAAGYSDEMERLRTRRARRKKARLRRVALKAAHSRQLATPDHREAV
ncbi:MAG: ion transporter [Planctomycetota bacterium]